MRMQTLRSAVREGGRAAAVCNGDVKTDCIATVKQRTVDTSLGAIGSVGNVDVSKVCNRANIGTDVTVSDNLAAHPSDQVTVRIPFMPVIHLTPTISASFRCEV